MSSEITYTNHYGEQINESIEVVYLGINQFTNKPVYRIAVNGDVNVLGTYRTEADAAKAMNTYIAAKTSTHIETPDEAERRIARVIYDHS